MPIYEYQCTSCHHQFDMLQKISDSPLNVCPACGKNTAERLVSAAGFQLKGTGWYATDYKNKPQKESPKKESASTTMDAKTPSDDKARTKGSNASTNKEKN